MRAALKDAGIQPEEVGYVNAHATSTPAGDGNESLAIEKVFGEHALSHKLKISGTKSMTGHLLGAAGAIEAVACLKAIGEGIIPPTINTKNLDPAIPKGLNILLGAAIERPVKVAMSNTFGFGGHNGIVVFRKM